MGAHEYMGNEFSKHSHYCAYLFSFQNSVIGPENSSVLGESQAIRWLKEQAYFLGIRKFTQKRLIKDGLPKTFW